MNRTALFVACFACFSMTAMAQQNALTSALDSPIKMEAESYAANEQVACSLVLPASAALFGTDYDPNSGIFIQNELFSPFRIFQFDENCAITGTTWSTIGVVGTTLTGIGYPNSTAGTTYWACDPFGGATISEYGFGTGIATGAILATPLGGSVWGGLVVDNNQPGEVMCLIEIALDSTTCIDSAAGGTVLCSYPNADNAGGGGAFGNGISDAVSLADCSGQTLLNASGTITEGQVTRAGQYDCTGNDPACTDRWSFAITGSTFINGIAEYPAASGARNLMCADNVTSTMFNLEQPVGVADCQAIDAGMDLLWVNGSQGAGSFTVQVDSNGPVATGIQKPAQSSLGKLVMKCGSYVGGAVFTVVLLPFRLGAACLDFLDAEAGEIIQENIGKTNATGPSRYFGMPVPNPPLAPTHVEPTRPVFDVSNMPAGSQWIMQAIMINPAASADKPASLTNALVLSVE